MGNRSVIAFALGAVCAVAPSAEGQMLEDGVPADALAGNTGIEILRPEIESGHPTGLVFFERLKGLEGEWAAPMSNGVMINKFRPMAFGSAVLHEEWLNGELLTATVFYMVGSELRADHFCDYKNQLRYAGRTTADSTVIKFELLEALNLDTEPAHFRSTTWRFLDATHLTQDWEAVRPGKEPKVVRMEFTRQK